MVYVVEFYREGTEECLERREFSEPPWGIPQQGDSFHVEFADPKYAEEYGPVWKVMGRVILLFASGSEVRVIQLFCRPRKASPVSVFEFRV